MPNKPMLAAAALAATAAAGASAQTVITFDNLPGGVNASPLTYPEATFTSSTGRFFVGASGVDDEICPLTAAFNCEATLTVDFATPVDDLSFLVNGDNSVDSVLTVSILAAGGASTFLFGDFDDVLATFSTVDLSAFSRVTRITLSSDDVAGLSYDTFSFNAAVVPEPAAWALMIAGIGLAGGGLRARRARTRLRFA